MKKTFVKALALTLTAVILVCTLVSCGKTVSGTYGSEIEFLGQKWEVTYKFSGKNVEAESKATVLGQVNSKTAKGTYEISENDDGTLEITFDFEEETDIFKNKTLTFSEGEDYIKLAGIEYKKK